MWTNMKTGQKSGDYWEERYSKGGDSGEGSYGPLSAFKATYINGLVIDHKISSVIDMGVGDGHQLTLLALEQLDSYCGIDVSKTTLARLASKYADRPNYKFTHSDDYDLGEQAFDLTISLDVIFHLVEDDVFKKYIRDCLLRSRDHAIFYSSNRDENVDALHVRHRKFTSHIEKHFPEWHLIQRMPNMFPEKSFCDFFHYRRRAS